MIVTQISQAKPLHTSQPIQWGWVSAALGAHMMWGMYPVLGRYLQTIGQLPTFSILALGNFVVLLIVGRYLIAHTSLSVFKQPIIWVFGGIVVLRAITNIASTRFTLSIYVQLITQATPFIVILLSTLIFREELPRFTVPAVAMAMIGALMMIGTDFGGAALNDPSRRDWLGVGLAMVSVVSLSIYMVLIRRTVKHQISGETLLLVQLAGIVLVSSVASAIIREDWTAYLRLDWTGWVMMTVFTFGVFWGANVGQIQSIRHIGAPMVSSMLASRLVSALFFGAVVLNEHLESVWQMMGAGIVLVTITAYLWQQRQRT